MSKKDQLSDIHNSGKSYIIYKSKKGFDLFTNFSKKIILNNKNIDGFLNKKHKNNSRNTDLYIEQLRLLHDALIISDDLLQQEVNNGQTQEAWPQKPHKP